MSQRVALLIMVLRGKRHRGQRAHGRARLACKQQQLRMAPHLPCTILPFASLTPTAFFSLPSPSVWMPFTLAL